MKNQTLTLCILVGSLLFVGSELSAQQIVHALCGTVSSINTADKTITLFQDSGSPATFRVMPSSHKRISFDEKVASQVTWAQEFQTKGAYVILFYFGTQENRTAVALKSLGSGPFSSTTGEITEWNGHNHKLSVRDKQGTIHSYLIDPKTVAETYMGVVNGSKVDLDKGQQVRLVSSQKDGNKTALFIREE